MRKLEEEKKIKKEFNLLLRKNKGTNQLFEQIYDFYYYGRYAEDSFTCQDHSFLYAGLSGQKRKNCNQQRGNKISAVAVSEPV